ncbi:MAG: acyl-CoA thioesterase [Acidimicrobiales bacterium]
MTTAGVREFIGLSATEDPSCWRLAVTPAALTPAGAVQGGVVFAAAVEAMQGSTGRRLAWATGQYLSHLGHPATASVSVRIDVAGHRTTQARAVVSHDRTDVLVAIGAFGQRGSALDGTWVTAPTVPTPDACAPRAIPGRPDGTAVCDVRAAVGRSYPDVDGHRGPGRSASWVRLPGGGRRVPSAGDLAIIGDFVMLEVADAVGVAVTGNSLDNTLRSAHRADTEWVLLDATIHAVAGGFCSATADLWAEDGTLPRDGQSDHGAARARAQRRPARADPADHRWVTVGETAARQRRRARPSGGWSMPARRRTLTWSLRSVRQATP